MLLLDDVLYVIMCVAMVFATFLLGCLAYAVGYALITGLGLPPLRCV